MALFLCLFIYLIVNNKGGDDKMEIVYLALGAIAVIILIVIIYHIVQWRWSKVDKYELQQNSKNKALDLFDKFMSLFDKDKDDDSKF